MGTNQKEKVRLLAIQMESVIGELELNIDTVKNLLIANLEKYEGADFVFLPEVWTVGWYTPAFIKSAETLENSKAVNMLKEIAVKYNTNIIGGSFIRKKPIFHYPQSDDAAYYNSCPVINRHGEVVAIYDKNHLFSYYGDDEGIIITKGSNPVMVELDGVKIGLTICFDIRFPEIYRAYRKAGADILVNMAAWGKTKKIPWDTMTTSRAIENQTYMVALTQTGLLPDGKENLGHSMIIDYNGNIIDQIEDIEGGVYAEVDLHEMYDFRAKCTILNDIKEAYEVVKK